MSQQSTDQEFDHLERLQKVLANRGVTSRRKAEDLITAGRVAVDGEIVRELGAKVDPHNARIEVDGELVPPAGRRYIMLNKPPGYITTLSDERGRRTVQDLVQVPERVVPVGRLDRPTEGLLLMMNDGELAYRIMHPKFEIEKEYEVHLDGVPPRRVLDMVAEGVTIDGQRTVPTFVRPVRQTEEGTVVRLGIHEGRNRIVRRIFETVDYPVIRLIRVRIGPVQLGNLRRGEWRDLTAGELQQLQEAADSAARRVRDARRPPARDGSRRRPERGRHPERRRPRD